MTAAAIARLAGVGRAAVSNWRRRYPRFPKPVGGSSASPTFDRAEVEAWLTATGKADRLATAGRTKTGTQRITGWARRDDQGSLGPRPQLGRAITELASRRLLARVMVSLLPRSTAFVRPGDDDTDLPRVLDPACSEATLLQAVADRFGDRVRLVGQEIEESVGAAATLKLRVNASGAPYEVHIGNSLLDNRLSKYLGAAAAVICEPPRGQSHLGAVELRADLRWAFGIPAPRDGELAWVQHCYAHLRPRGVAVVAVSLRTCVAPSGQPIRSALVRSGVLRDVIALPKGTGTSPDTCLWVLQRPTEAPGQSGVRMVDLSGSGDPADVPREHTAWQRLLSGAEPTICRAVPRLELLDGDTNLLPSRRVVARVEARAEDIARVTDRLQVLYARVGRGLPRYRAPRSPARHDYVTFAQLERIGALTIRSRDTTPRAGDLLIRTLGQAPAVATGTDADDAGVAQVVEIDATRLDVQFVATFLRADAQALPVANTLGALSRDDLRRCRIPRMSIAEQRRYGEAFFHLNEVRSVLTALAATSVNVIDQTIHGLTTGALAPGSGAPHDEKREL